MRRCALLLVLVGACVPSRATVHAPVRRATPDARVPVAIDELLKKPLDLDAAVRIAIANNAHLQAEYENLGIAAAGIAEATVLAPLEVDFSYARDLDGQGGEIEFDAVQDILGLLLMPQRRGAAKAELAATQARAVDATIALAAKVEIAFYDLVAAQQSLELHQTAFDAASASAEIVERMHVAGNATDLELARERQQRENERIEVARAEGEIEVRREAINRLLGLSGADTNWSVAARLPDVPDEAPALDDLEQNAVAENLELEALRHEADAARSRRGIARARTFLPELGVGVAVGREDEEDWHVGPAIRIALPIFDQQQGPRTRAKHEQRKAEFELTATAVDVRALARAARQTVLVAHGEAVHLRDVVLPLGQEVLDETLKQYNAMNATSFELLSAKRDLVDAGQQYIDALRRYWVAVAEVTALRRGVALHHDDEEDQE